MPHPATVLTPAMTLVLTLLASMPSQAQISADCRAMFEGDRLSVIVPNAPGGGYDTYGRAMAPVLATVTGARVSVENLPSAGGLVASRRIIEARPDEWVILVDEAVDVLHSIKEGELGPEAGEKMRLMSVFHAEPSAWVVRPGFDALDPQDVLVVGASSVTNENAAFRLLGEALGFSSRTIDNYSGTNAISLGLLGGEIDVMSVSLGSALRTTKAGDLEIAFVLSESLAPAAPDLPYLLGPGGQLEPHLAGMNDADRAEALRIGELVADLGFVLRTVIVPTALPADRMACLESAVNVVLFSDEFRDAAEAEGREVNALSPEAAQAALAQQAEALALASAPGKAAP